MSTIVRITGAIDRCYPDPQAPSDPQSAWIGMVTVEGAIETKQAAVSRIATGRPTGEKLWGPYVLVLRWIGDPPSPEIAQAVYDVVRDGGPAHRSIDTLVECQPRSEAQPSYRPARNASAS